jgi:hypothetical protein
MVASIIAVGGGGEGKGKQGREEWTKVYHGNCFHKNNARIF